MAPRARKTRWEPQEKKKNEEKKTPPTTPHHTTQPLVHFQESFLMFFTGANLSDFYFYSNTLFASPIQMPQVASFPSEN